MSSRRPPVCALWSLFLAGFACAAAAHELTGTVQLLAKGGKALDKTADVRTVVVVFRAKGGAGREMASHQTFKMVTVRKEFQPRVLAIPQGSTVVFPNADPILHNVFSVSPESRFDLGLYRQGPGKSWTFKSPGLVRVFCNIHQAMVAYIYVLDSPYYATPDGSGRFAIHNAPDQPGTLEVWHEQAEIWNAPLVAGKHEPVMARLEVTRPRLPAHTNKLGQSYNKRGNDY